jgi:hypothetical protein
MSRERFLSNSRYRQCPELTAEPDSHVASRCEDHGVCKLAPFVEIIKASLSKTHCQSRSELDFHPVVGDLGAREDRIGAV